MRSPLGIRPSWSRNVYAFAFTRRSPCQACLLHSALGFADLLYLRQALDLAPAAQRLPPLRLRAQPPWPRRFSRRHPCGYRARRQTAAPDLQSPRRTRPGTSS
eukprot:scaffold1830_cov246-Pinguiococcus_pyrenoidosus.AAC.14